MGLPRPGHTRCHSFCLALLERSLVEARQHEPREEATWGAMAQSPC